MLMTAVALAAHLSAAGPKSAAHAVVSHSRSAWEVVYTLDRRAPAWVFPVSAPTLDGHQPWRPAAWRVLTPDVRIERHGAYDLLIATKSRTVPRTVRIAFTPTAVTLDREYDPAVSFGAGAVALYSAQFDIAPVDKPERIDGAEPGLSIEELGGASIPVRFRDTAGPVFVAGRRQLAPVLTGAQTYVVFGAAKVERINGVAMLADPALPAWLKSDIAAFAPRVAALYAARLDARRDPGLPLLLLGWRGPTAGKVINDGGVRPGQILFNFEGEGLLERNPRAALRTHWFIAHELAHFWLGTSGVAAKMPGDAWITEGGAEMMAFSLLAETDHDYALAELQRAVGDCIRLAARPVAEAERRHESRAFYACGAVFALSAAHAGGGNGDVFAFLRPLLTAHRVDRTLGAADWLDRFAAVSRNDKATRSMRTLLSQGSDHAADAVATILDAGGVRYQRKGDTITLAPDAI